MKFISLKRKWLMRCIDTYCLICQKKKERAFICLRWKYTFNVKGDWWFFPRKSWFDFLWIRESWSMVIRSYDIYVGEFFYLNVHELWVESWIKRDSWTILRDAFPVILSFWKCSYFSRTVVVRFWQGFWQEMEILWIDNNHKTDF